MTERPSADNNWGDPHDYVGAMEMGITLSRDDETQAMFTAALNDLALGQIPDNVEQLVRLARALLTEFGGPAR